MYAPKAANGVDFDLTWSTKVPVIAWDTAAVGSPDTADGVAVVGWVMDVDGDPVNPTLARGVLRPAHVTSFTGTDGREQHFMLYLPPAS